VTLDDIANFEKEYKESEEELADLKQAYLDGKGDMNFILDNVLCATLEDEPRFANILCSLIKEKDIPDFAKFSKESKKSKTNRKRRLEGEKAEAEEAAKELGMNGNDENSLRNMIMKRQQSREKEMDGFFDHLAAKYGGGDKKKTTKKGKK
jgi:DnaJ family protein C protein 9